MSDDEFHTPFSGLEKEFKTKRRASAPRCAPLTQKAEDKSLPARRPAPVEAEPACEDDDAAASFARAMHGVRPVGKKKGRALVPPPSVRSKSDEPDCLDDFINGKYEFALEYTEEFFEGRVLGLDLIVAGKLRAGQYSPEAHIDLHGLSAEQGYAALLAFIKSAYLQSRRNLLVVTGRGKNSPGGLGVLRRNMQEWLTKDPLKRVVLAFCTARPKDGGPGAMYVLLRKYKKTPGKVRWDRTPMEEGPLL